MKNRYKVVMHGNQPVVEDSEACVSLKWFPDVLHDRDSRRKAEAHAKLLNEHPTVAEFCHVGDVTILNDVDFEKCPRCGGDGKEPAAPAPGYGGIRPTAPGGECSECGGHGHDPRRGKPLFAIGIKSDMSAGIRGCSLTPWFESLAALENHCSARRADILKEIGE
jgi:hypothetical protein